MRWSQVTVTLSKEGAKAITSPSLSVSVPKAETLPPNTIVEFGGILASRFGGCASALARKANSAAASSSGPRNPESAVLAFIDAPQGRTQFFSDLPIAASIHLIPYPSMRHPADVL